jgi:NTE family protein
VTDLPDSSPKAPEFGLIATSPPGPDGTTRQVTVATKPPGKIDLVLEGGGVKGLGLVGAALTLSEVGYAFNRVAGASAGAIVATLLAALKASNRPVSDLETILGTIKYEKFAPSGFIQKARSDVRLLLRQGLHDGNYLKEWLGGQLDKLGITKFGQLKIDDADLPAERRYSLVVTVSDITRGKSVRLPWDYKEFYGLEADDQLLVDAVRASMSIPFFFEPVRVSAHATAQSPAGTCTWVDGGMLDNFPVDVFGRQDGEPGRWPTVGVKLSAQGPPPLNASKGILDEAKACLSTLIDNADRFYVTPFDAQRTIFVDHGTVQTTDFAITPTLQAMLMTNGRAAAAVFVKEAPDSPVV